MPTDNDKLPVEQNEYFNTPPHMDPEFVAAWCEMENNGYQYSDSNVAKVHLGWLMARHRIQAQQQPIVKRQEWKPHFFDDCEYHAPVARDGLVEALRGVDAWLERWATHVGRCSGGNRCTCGLTRAQFDCQAALASMQPKESPDA